MSGASLGLRTGSYGSLQQQVSQNGAAHIQSSAMLVRKPPSKKVLSGSREKFLPRICWFLGRKKVAMLLLIILALLVFVFGSFTVSKESSEHTISQQIQQELLYHENVSVEVLTPPILRPEATRSSRISGTKSGTRHLRYRDHLRSRLPHHQTSSITKIAGYDPPWGNRCENFAFPPPPPPDRRRIGPRPCPVCYLPIEQAMASMPKSPSTSPILRSLTYIQNEEPVKIESHGGSDFGGYPSLKERTDSFDIKESMAVHCGFVKGNKPGQQTGFDIDEADLNVMEQFYDVIVASGIFGNYDVIQQPRNVSEAARKNIPFFMFIDDETEAFMKNRSLLDSEMRVGLWRIIVVRNIPYSDARRNGKVPKLLLHRLFPMARYSIWIDGKLELVVDPYQVLERFLWRQNANFAISRHYKRFDVFEEAEANKAAGKYDNSSIDCQMEFYKKEGLTPYTEAKLPITSDVPEGCVIIREHIPITNLFTCLWFNEVDRFTARDQLSFSTVRDKIAAKVNWTVSMFLDCERRNFVIQAYHRDLLEHMPPPAIPQVRNPPALPILFTMLGKTPPRKSRRSPRRHRKVIRGGGGDKRMLDEDGLVDSSLEANLLVRSED